MFDSTARVHSHNIFIPRPRTEAGKRAFSYRGAVLCNTLPSDLRNQPNLKFETLESLDNYADTSTIISEIKKAS